MQILQPKPADKTRDAVVWNWATHHLTELLKEAKYTIQVQSPKEATACGLWLPISSGIIYLIYRMYEFPSLSENDSEGSIFIDSRLWDGMAWIIKTRPAIFELRRKPTDKGCWITRTIGVLRPNVGLDTVRTD